MKDQSFIPSDGTKHAPVRLFSKAPRAVKIRDERVRRLARKIARECPWLQAVDGFMLRAFAELQLLAEECYARIRNEGVSIDGKPHHLLVEFRSLTRVQLSLAAALGLVPNARESMQAVSTASALAGIDLGKVEKIMQRLDERTEANGDDSGNSEPRA
jgi:phage terminase small subunit